MSKTPFLRRFVKAKKGMAAVEFALLAPMMMFVLFGSVDLIDLLDVNRRVGNVAASVADVVARDTEISNSEITGLWAAIDVLMFPDDGDPVNIRITSISVESATTARVVWSEGRGMAPLSANSTIEIPAGMMTAGTSVILAETEMDYQGPMGFLVGAPNTISHEAYRRSRLVDPIPRVS